MVALHFTHFTHFGQLWKSGPGSFQYAFERLLDDKNRPSLSAILEKFVRKTRMQVCSSAASMQSSQFNCVVHFLSLRPPCLLLSSSPNLHATWRCPVGRGRILPLSSHWKRPREIQSAGVVGVILELPDTDIEEDEQGDDEADDEETQSRSDSARASQERNCKRQRIVID